MKKTVYAVIAFIIVLILAGYSAKSNANDDYYFQIGIGQSVVNSSFKTGEVGFHAKNWELQATLQESGTARGRKQDLVDISTLYLT